MSLQQYCCNVPLQEFIQLSSSIQSFNNGRGGCWKIEFYYVHVLESILLQFRKARNERMTAFDKNKPVKVS